ncbi:MAG: HlyU family transcriptional regulator [Kiloniellaceae bacterium]
MGLFSKLFGGGGASGGSTSEGEAVEYNGYRIHPAAQSQNGQWLTAGIIRKEVAGETREHRFLRADTHASAEAANAFAVVKGRQIIDEQGDRIFED